MTSTTALQRRVGWFTFFTAVVTLICGFLGYRELAVSGSVPGVESTSDVIFNSMRALRLGIIRTYENRYLEVGRWSAQIFIFSFVLTFLVPRLARLWHEYRARFSREHTILIGSGPQAMSLLHGLPLRSNVVISDVADVDASSLVIDDRRLRPRFVRAQVLDGAHVMSLGLNQAARMVIATDTDTKNFAIAHDALKRISKKSRPEPVRLFILVRETTGVDEEISHLPVNPQVQVRALHAPTLSARHLASMHPFIFTGWYGVVTTPAWLFLGFDRFAQALLLNGLRMRPNVNGLGLRVHVVALGADLIRKNLVEQFPHAVALFSQVSFTEWSGSALEDVISAHSSPDASYCQTAAFVFSSTDESAFQQARQLRELTQRFERWRVPVFVRLDDISGFSHGLAPLTVVRRGEEAIEAFGLGTDSTADQDLDDWQERMAAQIHEAYMTALTGKGVDTTGLQQSWFVLRDEVRAANRRAIEHFAVKLALVGYQYGGGAPGLVGRPVLSEKQMDHVARLEHASWSAEKWLAGWRHNEVRDDSRRLHDCLVPFEQLGAQVDKDISQYESLVGHCQVKSSVAASIARLEPLAIYLPATSTPVTADHIINPLRAWVAALPSGSCNLEVYFAGDASGLSAGLRKCVVAIEAAVKANDHVKIAKMTFVSGGLVSRFETLRRDTSILVDAELEDYIRHAPGISRWVDPPRSDSGRTGESLRYLRSIARRLIIIGDEVLFEDNAEPAVVALTRPEPKC